jgi:subtilisin family serine protease
VGALDPNDTLSTADDTVASFSATGPTIDGLAKPEILAPGRHIVSALPPDTGFAQEAPASNTVAPGYVRANGTSFSAPQVAGAAAILLQLHPTWTPDQVKWALMQTARPVPGSQAGTLDIGSLIALSGTPLAANQGVVPAPQGVEFKKNGRVMRPPRGTPQPPGTRPPRGTQRPAGTPPPPGTPLLPGTPPRPGTQRPAGTRGADGRARP